MPIYPRGSTVLRFIPTDEAKRRWKERTGEDLDTGSSQYLSISIDRYAEVFGGPGYKGVEAYSKLKQFEVS